MIECRAFSVKQVAKILGVTPKCVYDMVKGGTLYAVKIGKGSREIRIPRTTINKFLEGDCVNGTGTRVAN